MNAKNPASTIKEAIAAAWPTAYGKRYSGQELAAISNSIAVLGAKGPTIINLMMAPETRACSAKY
jgi:hypothetical protein